MTEQLVIAGLIGNRFQSMERASSDATNLGKSIFVDAFAINDHWLITCASKSSERRLKTGNPPAKRVFIGCVAQTHMARCAKGGPGNNRNEMVVQQPRGQLHIIRKPSPVPRVPRYINK